MGQARRERAQQEAAKKRRNSNLIRVAAAGLALTGAAIALNLVRGGGDGSETPAVAAATPDVDFEKPADVPEVVKKYLADEAAKQPSGDFKKFAEQYKHIEDRQIGASTVHYIQIGPNAAQPKDIDLHAQGYEHFQNMANQRLSFTVNAYPVEQVNGGGAVTPAEARIVATPDAEQDLYVMFVDPRLSLGQIGGTNIEAQAFTSDNDDNSEAAFTFVRNESTEGKVNGITTEACQAAVAFQLENNTQFQMSEAGGNMVDEPACNLFGTLMASKALDQPYATYESRRHEALFSTRLFFADPTATHALEIPIATEQYYNTFPMQGDIPAPGAGDLAYPLMDPYLAH